MLRRRRARLSQPELAQQAEMSVTTLNRVENAHQSLYMEKIAALARALETTTDYLLGLSDDPGTASERPVQEALPSQPAMKRQRTRKAASVG